jgi:hypothetical protein
MYLVFWTISAQIRPSSRPRIPDSAHGFLTLTQNKFGDLYTTAFENWANSQGVILAIGLCLLGAGLYPGILKGARIPLEHPRLVVSLMAISLITWVALWWSLVP